MKKRIIFLSESLSEISGIGERILEIMKLSLKKSSQNYIHCHSINSVFEHLKFNDVGMIILGYKWLLGNAIGKNFLKDTIAQLQNEEIGGLKQIVIILQKDLFSEKSEDLNQEEKNLKQRLSGIKGSKNVIIFNNQKTALDMLREFFNGNTKQRTGDTSMEEFQSQSIN